MDRMIFISHSSLDNPQIRKWTDFIKDLGFKIWFDETDLDVSKERWSPEIEKAIDNCDKVFLYVTANALQSGQVENEVHYASSKRKNIIPFMTQELDLDRLKLQLNKYEWLRAYEMDEDMVKDILRERLLENYNALREEYLDVTLSPAYKSFVHEVMRRYYGEDFFTVINGIDFHVFTVKGKPVEDIQSIEDFDILCDYENSSLENFNVEDHQSYDQNKYYKEYYEVLKGTIRYPNRPGYMLDRLITDEDGLADKVQVHVGTYAENVYSSHVLEYELYKAYLSHGKKDLNDDEVWAAVKADLTIRNHIHQGAGDICEDGFRERMLESLLCGKGRDSLLSVQMLVIIKSAKSHRYEVKIIKRSKQVAAMPDIYQFLPAGGFEILNDSDDDIYDDSELFDNFSPGCAVFREYLEELFNAPEMEGGGKARGSIEERLLKDERIIEIERMLKDKTAELEFLGSVMDLVGLRHELSFVLVIHDENHEQKSRFIGNEECKKGEVNSTPVSDFDNRNIVRKSRKDFRADYWENLHGPSAAMWNLFKETELYKSIQS